MGGKKKTKMVSGMLDPEMIEDTVKIVNEAGKDKVWVNLIINNRAGGNAPLIAQEIADSFHFDSNPGLQKMKNRLEYHKG